MAKTQAFTYFIGHGTALEGEDYLVHQSSPTWVLTFIRWNVRDTIRAITPTGNSPDLLTVRAPLVIESDCTQVAVVVNKSILTHSMNAVLLETDVNYSTAIAPGDFVFVNILNSEQEARRVATIASGLTGQINGINDGFKGVFKVQSVRKSLEVDPDTGLKRVLIKISGFAFTEFNNMIYYNPHLNRENQGSAKDDLLFPTNIQSDYSQLISTSSNITCQDIIKKLIQSFLGVGINDRGVKSVSGLAITPNTHFYMPSQVGVLLGVANVTAAKDIYSYLFGIQQYSAGSSVTPLQTGATPSNLETSNPPDRFFYTKQRCPGQTLLKAEYWNQTNAWSIINQYTNSPINELYTCFRTDPSGKVMPTVVFRQIPFTSDAFGTAPFNSQATVTPFSTLPRWKVGNSTIFAVDLGRDEAARINFVQYYSSPPADIPKQDSYFSAQTAQGNFTYDINDVLRSGLRPNVVTSTFGNLARNDIARQSRDWAFILGDALIGGHLRLNGTIEAMGIIDPIAVGDNLEYDGAVYHIEEITHSCSIAAQSGIKIFRTILKLSHGVSISTPTTGLAYPEMVHTRGYQDRDDDYEYGDQLLPGVSEEQDIRSRANNPTPGVPTLAEVQAKDRPFAQPGQVIKSNQDSDQPDDQ